MDKHCARRKWRALGYPEGLAKKKCTSATDISSIQELRVAIVEVFSASVEGLLSVLAFVFPFFSLIFKIYFFLKKCSSILYLLDTRKLLTLSKIDVLSLWLLMQGAELSVE